MRNVFTIAMVLAAALLANSASSQETGLHAKVNLDGMTLQCKDFRGQTVRTIRMDDIGDVARASIINRMPIITLNPLRLETLPGKLQVFFFNHECGHHVMGHVFNPSPTSENEADCWSIKQGRDGKFFTRADVEAFAPHLANSRGTPLGHLPGPERAARLLACFDDPSDELVDPQGFKPQVPAESARSGG
jgi:hypothetical protein